MQGVDVEILKETMETWDGTKILPVHLDNPCITMAKYIVKSGVQLPRHKHPLIYAGYILSGEITVYKDNGDKIDLVAGDSCIELFEQWHSGKNNGSCDCVIIVFNIGEKDTPVSILAEVE